MNPKEIVTTLRSVAADPAHRGKLLKEQNCMPSLLKFLQHEDPEVYFTALEVCIFFQLYFRILTIKCIGSILAFTTRR